MRRKKRRNGAENLLEQSELLQQVLAEATNVSAQFDPLGSYTGNPKDGEDPVQDADDL